VKRKKNGLLKKRTTLKSKNGVFDENEGFSWENYIRDSPENDKFTNEMAAELRECSVKNLGGCTRPGCFSRARCICST